MRGFSARLAALEALERAARPDRPAYVCVHPVDWAAYADPATPASLKAAIEEAYGLAGPQKVYVGLCLCDAPESCRVCADQPLVNEVAA